MSLFQLAITIGIVVSYLVDLAFAPIEGWRWMLGLAVVPAAVLATLIGLPCGIAMAKLLERVPMFALKPVEESREMAAGENATAPEMTTVESIAPQPLTPMRKAILLLFFLTFIAIFIVIAYPSTADAWPRLIGADWRFADLFPDLAGKPVLRVVKTISVIAVPFLLSFFPLYATLRAVNAGGSAPPGR